MRNVIWGVTHFSVFSIVHDSQNKQRLLAFTGLECVSYEVGSKYLCHCVYCKTPTEYRNIISYEAGTEFLSIILIN